jgi:hypothetical protein
MELRRVVVALAVCCSLLTSTACLARRRVITRKGTSTTAPKLLLADKQGLLSRIAALDRITQTLNATVDMVPAVGSVNRGQITEYKDIRAFILFRKPADIRIIGLYPVVRNKAFDMVSTGPEFRLYVPSKNRFITGRNEVPAPSANKLEALRPSVFQDALLIRPLDAAKESAVLENLTDEDNAYYIVHFLSTDGNGGLHLARNVWFDRITLQISRQVIFDTAGEILTDARYSDWKMYDNVPFPRVIDINRPKDEYGVVISVVKADINKPLTDDKFALVQPEGTVLQVLTAKPAAQAASEAAGNSSASRVKQKK